MKVSQVLEVLVTLGYAYPNTKLPTDPQDQSGMTAVWHGALGDLDYGHVMDAVKQHIRNEKWFPAPAEIRHAAIRLQAGLPSPAIAWGDVRQAAGSADRAMYERLHPVALYALRDIGGPSAITLSMDIGRTRDAYLKAYEARTQEVYTAPTATPIPKGLANKDALQYELTGGE